VKPLSTIDEAGEPFVSAEHHRTSELVLVCESLGPGLSRFNGQKLSLNPDVFRSVSEREP
jgi:hypothetical protein